VRIINTFQFSTNPKECAQWHCDKHTIKQILEYAQLLSTAHRVLDGDSVQSYRNYFNGSKQHLAAGKNRYVPEWYFAQ
jgi:hypothetical protein